jgi:hypothetical protein
VKTEKLNIVLIHGGFVDGSGWAVMHSHPDSVAIFQNDGHCRFTFPDGKTEEHKFRAGETMLTPAGSHLPENLGDHKGLTWFWSS